MATELNPLSVLARLSPYLGGSSNIVIYSQHLPVLAEVLVHAKSAPIYLNPTLTESWTRTYQVLPGRTHPLMSTSSTGGYLISMIRV
jgi:tRNA (adenine-N(1)-)-methyltransferase non-catalytic subunit